MKFTVQKTNILKGEVLAPASKSQTIRGLILGLLSRGTSTLFNPLFSDDTLTAIKVCRALGARIILKSHKIIVFSKGSPLPRIKYGASSNPLAIGGEGKVDTGDSGITTRFILPILGLRKNSQKIILLDCGKQMRRRPIAPLVLALNNLGMAIKYNNQNGQCPLLVSGGLLGGKTQVEGITSQYLSALLLSLPLAPKNSEIIVKNLHERPYVNMTLAWLKDLGIKIFVKHSRNVDVFKIPGNQIYSSFKKTIPGDFSSASCLLAAGCLISGKIVLKGLDLTDFQGDKRLIKILRTMGAKIIQNKKTLTIFGGKPLFGIKINAKDIPDLLPALAIIGTQAKGKTEIVNVAQARFKETDRLKSMAEGLKRMSALVKEKKDGLVIYQSKLKGATVKGYGDHRTVMAFSVAGLLAEGKTIITDAQSVEKTFPKFSHNLQNLGAKISSL